MKIRKVNENFLKDVFFQLVVKTSTELPPDVEGVLKRAYRREKGVAKDTIGVILENVRMARNQHLPICQDTGYHSWDVYYPEGFRTDVFRRCIVSAVRKATRMGYLRPNSVDPVTTINSGDNIGEAHPRMELHPWRKSSIVVELLLKGGGSENVSAQLKLPMDEISAGRDLDGVRKAVLYMVNSAQGGGCSPGFVSVCIGGDRQAGFEAAKANLKKRVGSVCSNPALERLRKRILREVNLLGIGPMGLGGKTTVLDVYVCSVSRHPACYFVTCSYGCWAVRRWSVRININSLKFSFYPHSISGG